MDRKGLMAFADQLKDCEHTIESIGYLDEINTAYNQRRIVQRLPLHLRTKFIEVTDQIQQADQRTNISHIAEFVKVKARAANNPVFGCVVDVSNQSERLENQRRKPKFKSPTLPEERARTFNTQETETGDRHSLPSNRETPAIRFAKCQACKGDHPLVECKNFKDKTLKNVYK